MTDTGRRRYILNIIWGWSGALTLILSGLLVSPFLIRRLGAEQFGIWTLGLSLVEYFWLIDIGLRPATVKLSAEYRTLQDWSALNRTLSTIAAYTAPISLLIVTLLWFGAESIAAFFRISHPAFPLIIRLTGCSWALGLFANMFSATIEGFQRFDIANATFIVFSAVRSLALVLLVALGYGLREMAIALFIMQTALYLSFVVSCFHIFPQMSLSWRSVNQRSAIELWRFSRQMISGIISVRLLASLIPTLVARALPISYVTYYSATQKILDYCGEGVGRIGHITAPRATEWMTLGRTHSLQRLARYGNRYCLTFWLLLCSYLVVYGANVFALWVNPDFSRHATPLLFAMLVGQAFWPGQFLSAAILTGIGRYSRYSFTLAAESVATIAAFAVLLPSFGLIPAILVASTLMILSRTLILSWIISQELQMPWVPFLSAVYLRPFLLTLPAMAALWAVKNWLVPGTSWFQLISVGFSYAGVYGLVAFSLIMEPEHRALVVEQLRARLIRYRLST